MIQVIKSTFNLYLSTFFLSNKFCKSYFLIALLLIKSSALAASILEEAGIEGASGRGRGVEYYVMGSSQRISVGTSSTAWGSPNRCFMGSSLLAFKFVNLVLPVATTSLLKQVAEVDIGDVYMSAPLSVVGACTTSFNGLTNLMCSSCLPAMPDTYTLIFNTLLDATSSACSIAAAVIINNNISTTPCPSDDWPDSTCHQADPSILSVCQGLLITNLFLNAFTLAKGCYSCFRR